MRDIRSDLEERAHIIQEQVRVAYAHFERMAQQLQSERDARVADLKGSLATKNRGQLVALPSASEHRKPMAV